MRRRFLKRGVGAAAALVLGAPPAAADPRPGFDDRQELPDQLPIRFSLPRGGRFFPTRVVLIGPRGAAAAALPKRAAPRRENRAPVARLPILGAAFEERPFLDRIGPETLVGLAYRRDDDLVAALETDAAYEQAVRRAEAAVALIAREPRGRRLISFSPPLRLAAIPRGEALSGSLGAPVGEAHAAADAFIFAPPQDQLPRFDLF